ADDVHARSDGTRLHQPQGLRLAAAQHDARAADRAGVVLRERRPRHGPGADHVPLWRRCRARLLPRLRGDGAVPRRAAAHHGGGPGPPAAAPGKAQPMIHRRKAIAFALTLGSAALLAEAARPRARDQARAKIPLESIFPRDFAGWRADALAQAFVQPAD